MKLVIENYNCENCNNIFPIPRNKGQLRNKKHIKDIYCIKCKKITKHLNIKE